MTRRKWILFSISQLEKHKLHVKFTVSDFYFFYDPRKKRKEEKKKKKKIGKQGNRTISFDDTIDTLSLFPRPTQNLEDIFWLVLIHRSNHFHIIL